MATAVSAAILRALAGRVAASAASAAAAAAAAAAADAKVREQYGDLLRSKALACLDAVLAV